MFNNIADEKDTAKLREVKVPAGNKEHPSSTT